MLDIVLSVALIVVGSMIIFYYNGLKKKEKNGLTINLLGSGIGFIMIGIALIYHALF